MELRKRIRQIKNLGNLYEFLKSINISNESKTKILNAFIDEFGGEVQLLNDKEVRWYYVISHYISNDDNFLKWFE